MDDEQLIPENLHDEMVSAYALSNPDQPYDRTENTTKDTEAKQVDIIWN